MAAIPRRHFQGAQYGYGRQRKALFHHGRVHIPPAGNAATKAAPKPVITLNPAGHILALQQSREPCRRHRATIGPRGIAATSLTTGGRRYAGKTDNAVTKTQGFAIKNTDLRGLGRDGPIRGGGAEQVGRQAKSKDQRGHHGTSNPKPRTAKAGAELPTFENTPRFSHRGWLTDFYTVLQLPKM
jgi:hypothetical protein